MKQTLILTTLLCLCTPTTKTIELSKNAKIAGAAVVAAGSTYLLSKGYCSYVVSSAQTRFKTERALLNQYALYTNEWNAELDRQLKDYLKAEMVKLHNKNRNKWAITLLYEYYYEGKPAYSIDERYKQFPLLQHKNDLDWYLKRLKVIGFLSLYADQYELNLLIEQLNYIKNFIVSDHDYNSEEQVFVQRG